LKQKTKTKTLKHPLNVSSISDEVLHIDSRLLQKQLQCFIERIMRGLK